MALCPHHPFDMTVCIYACIKLQQQTANCLFVLLTVQVELIIVAELFSQIATLTDGHIETFEYNTSLNKEKNKQTSKLHIVCAYRIHIHTTAHTLCACI